MANNNQKGLLIALGVGVGGFALYKYMQSKNGMTIPLNTTSPGILPTSTVPTGTNNTAFPPPQSGLPAPPITSAGRPFEPPSTATGSNNGAITADVRNTVMSWVQADNKPPSAALAMANIPSEFNGMAAIINGGWQPTPDQRTFWNDIVNKYDPMRKYW
jgi:hypothetical protein